MLRGCEALGGGEEGHWAGEARGYVDLRGTHFVVALNASILREIVWKIVEKPTFSLP